MESTRMPDSVELTICSVCGSSGLMDSMISVVSLGYSICSRCFIISEAMSISALLHGIRNRSQNREMERVSQRNVELLRFGYAVSTKLGSSEEEWINSILHATNRKFEETACRLGMKCSSVTIKESFFVE